MNGWRLGIRNLDDGQPWLDRSKEKLDYQFLLHGMRYSWQTMRLTIATTSAGRGLKLKAYDGGSRPGRSPTVTAARMFLTRLDSNNIPINPANQNLESISMTFLWRILPLTNTKLT